MTILVTNDDGLTDGLRILIESADMLDKESYAICPHEQKSAVAKGVTLHKVLRLRRLEDEEHQVYKLNGTPADCAGFGIYSGEFKKPDLVLSGVNLGTNLSLHAIYSSGTIGACIEATFYGVPAIAFSYEMNGEEREKAPYCKWKNRENLKNRIIEITKKLKGKIPPYTIITVNFPKNFEDAEIVFPKPALINYISTLEKRIDPQGKSYYWHYGKNRECEKGNDVYEFYIGGCITITPISILRIVDEALIVNLKKNFNQSFI